MPSKSITLTIKLYIKQAGKCHYCADDLNALVENGGIVELDHIIPLSSGGKSSKDNYVLSCQFCNRSKNAKTLEDFLRYIQPYKDGLVTKPDLVRYNQYLSLHSEFGDISVERESNE